MLFITVKHIFCGRNEFVRGYKAKFVISRDYHVTLLSQPLSTVSTLTAKLQLLNYDSVTSRDDHVTLEPSLYKRTRIHYISLETLFK